MVRSVFPLSAQVSICPFKSLINTNAGSSQLQLSPSAHWFTSSKSAKKVYIVVFQCSLYWLRITRKKKKKESKNLSLPGKLFATCQYSWLGELMLLSFRFVMILFLHLVLLSAEYYVLLIIGLHLSLLIHFSFLSFRRLLPLEKWISSESHILLTMNYMPLPFVLSWKKLTE